LTPVVVLAIEQGSFKVGLLDGPEILKKRIIHTENIHCDYCLGKNALMVATAISAG
jgi:hypothetical protein